MLDNTFIISNDDEKNHHCQVFDFDQVIRTLLVQQQQKKTTKKQECTFTTSDQTTRIGRGSSHTIVAGKEGRGAVERGTSTLIGSPNDRCGHTGDTDGAKNTTNVTSATSRNILVPPRRPSSCDGDNSNACRKQLQEHPPTDDQSKFRRKGTTTSTSTTTSSCSTPTFEQRKEVPVPPPSYQRLRACLDRSAKSQALLQEWDHRINGLPKSHSPTMVKSSRSRRQLQEGVVLPKWDGTPLINNPHCELGQPRKRIKKNGK